MHPSRRYASGLRCTRTHAAPTIRHNANKSRSRKVGKSASTPPAPCRLPPAGNGDSTMQSLHNAVTRTPPPAGGTTGRRPNPATHYPAPPACPANFPTSQQVEKPTSRKVGKLASTPPAPCRLRSPPSGSNHLPLPSLLRTPRTHVAPTSISHNTKEPASQETDKLRSRKAGKLESWRASHPGSTVFLRPQSVMVIAQYNHSILQSLHNAVTPPGARL